MAVRDFLRDHWPAAAISAAAAIGAAAVAMLLGMPPHRIVMATGPEGDAYYEIGKRYQAVLARANVDLQLVPVRAPCKTAPCCGTHARESALL